MTKSEKQTYLNKKSIAYWDGGILGGVEVKEIIHDIDDYAIVVIGVLTANVTVHKLKINSYNDERGNYIKYKNVKLYLADCLRIF